jgi:two-component system response regulator NreC
VTPIRVLVADDHPIVRDGIAGLLRGVQGIEVVAATGDGEEALSLIEARRPDVAVLDAAMPRTTGIDVARRIRESGGATAVVILSAHDEPAYVRAALEAGARGYVTKGSLTQDLLDAVRIAAKGGVFLSPSAAPPSAPASGRADAALTPREVEVLRLLARGLASKEIGRELGIGASTVDGYRSTLMAKLGVRSAAGLVKYAIRNGLASLEE